MWGTDLTAMSSASQDQVGAQMVRHRPANDLPDAGVQHHGEKQEIRRGRHERDVRDREPVGDPALQVVTFTVEPRLPNDPDPGADENA